MKHARILFSGALYFLRYLINYYGEFRSFFKLKTVFTLYLVFIFKYPIT